MTGPGDAPRGDGDRGAGSTPRDHRIGRQAALLRFLRASVVVVAVLGATDVVLPAPWNERAGIAMVAALVAVPALRVLWLVVRWLGKGDRRFALAGVALLAIMGSGLLLG